MKLDFKLLGLWLAYTLLLILGTGAYRSEWLTIVMIVGGSVLGMALPKLINLFSEHVLSRPEKIAQDAQVLVQATPGVDQLIHSYPFLFAFGAVSLYIITSSSSWFGKALVLSMGLRLMIDLYQSNQDKNVLHARWFGAFGAKLSPAEENIFVYGSMGIWVLLTILSLRA